MKKHLLIYIAALGTVLAGCNKQLETSPTNAVSGEIVLKNVANLNTIFEGTWASMMDDFYGGIFGNPGFKTIALLSDVMANDVNLIVTKYSYAPAYRFTQVNDKTQSRQSAVWNQLYKLINNQNIIIANADKVEGDATAKKVLKAQALALRAHLYTTLASFYQFSYQKDSLSKTVPLYTIPSSDTTIGNPKIHPERDLYSGLPGPERSAAVAGRLPAQCQIQDQYKCGVWLTRPRLPVFRKMAAGGRCSCRSRERISAVAAGRLYTWFQRREQFRMDLGTS